MKKGDCIPDWTHKIFFHMLWPVSDGETDNGTFSVLLKTIGPVHFDKYLSK